MKYAIKEIFSTVQGEGSQSGSPAVFVRFAGCNLWSGHDDKRGAGKGECAAWCDTEFVGGDKLSKNELIGRICDEIKSVPMSNPLIVITGGEPTLQLSKSPELVGSMLARGWRVSIETNGTIQCDVIDLLNEHENGHVTVSPKRMRGGADGMNHIQVRSGTDLKVVLPQFNSNEMDEMVSWKFSNRFIQPLDCGDLGERAIIECISEARRIGWRISVQTHKFMGLP